MKKISLLAFLFLTLSSCNSAYALNQEGFENYIQEIKAIARKQGVKETTLDIAFRNLKLNNKIVELDRKQPERKKGAVWQGYKERVVSSSRVATGKRKLKENLPMLKQIEKQFGVEKEILVGLWGAESNFGGYMGDFDMIRSLTTLAYEGRRREFFQKELVNALVILDQGHVSRSNFKGSWAGAFGQVQFMPSTFMKHAFDYNQDGRKDLWYNNGDALASAANYLNNIGWVGGIGWGKRVTLPPRFNVRYVNMKLPMYKWKQMGVQYADGSWLTNSGTQLKLIDPDGKYGSNREVYLVTENFDRIKEWNRSDYFATSIGLLAEEIGK